MKFACRLCRHARKPVAGDEFVLDFQCQELLEQVSVTRSWTQDTYDIAPRGMPRTVLSKRCGRKMRWSVSDAHVIYQVRKQWCEKRGTK